MERTNKESRLNLINGALTFLAAIAFFTSSF
jgi:hypothetical protein